MIWGVNRQGCRFSRPAPWMARGGGPPNHWRITGTPSLGEVPSGGARAFCLLLRFSKVSRCQGGTLSGRYLHNGYVLSLISDPGRLSGRLRRQASSHIWIAGRQLDKRWLSGRLREQAHHRLIARPPPMRQKKSSNGRPVATPAIPAYVPSHAVFLLSLALRPSRNQETTCPRLHALPYLS